MNEKEKSINKQTEEKLPRRNFVTGALLTGAALFSTGRANASVTEETASFAAPTPADALVDFLDLFHGIGQEILKSYYIIIGTMSIKISGTYSDLKKATKEFVALVPELKNDFDIARLQNLAEIGKLAAFYINGLSGENGAKQIANHTSLVKTTSNNLETLAADYQARNASIKLSPAAEAKLRTVLQLIADLNKPVADMNKAASELNTNSSKLNGNIRTSTALIKEAIRILVAAEIIESPPDKKSLDVVIANLSARTPPYPTSVAALREMAAKKVEEAKDNLATIVSTFKISAELQKYVDEARKEQAERDKTAKVENQTDKTESVSADVLQDLLVGAASWIRNPKQFFGGNKQTGKSVEYVSANFTNPAVSLFDLWDEVRAILVELVPQATWRRTYQLCWRKACASVHPYAVQYKIFYHLIVNLDEPNDVDLYRNVEIRKAAAARLASLRVSR